MQIFLLLEALVWLPYGLYLIFDPEFLVGATEGGLLVANPTGLTEIWAMYGGLQAAIGASCLLAVLRPAGAAASMRMLVFLSLGLFLGRLCGLLVDGGLSGYTAGALVFEGVTVTGSWYFLRGLRAENVRAE